MLLPLTLAISLQGSSITLPVAYYSLQQIGQELTRQGVKAEVALPIRNDLYAVNIKSLPWPTLKKALERDERILITEKDGTWHISQNQANKAAEDRALRRYKSEVAAQIYAHFGAADKKLRELEAMEEPERSKEIQRIRGFEGKGGVEGTIAYFVYIITESRDIPFSTVSVPAAMTNPRSPSEFNRFYGTNFWDTRHLQSPTGSMREYQAFVRARSEEEAETRLKQLQFGVKMLLDPLTLACGVRTVARGDIEGRFVQMGGLPPRLLSPTQLKLSVDSQKLWDKPLASVESASPLLQKRVQVSGENRRLSSQMLEWASATGTNFISYVPAFTDYGLHPLVESSAAQLVIEANANGIDPAWILRTNQQRFSSDFAMPMKPGIRGRRVDLSADDGVVVLRDRFRFLDGWKASPNGPSPKLQSQLFRGEPPSLMALAQEIAATEFTGSIFSTNYLEFCNPLAFKPFAHLLLRSKAVQEAARTADSLRPRSIAYDTLSAADRAEFEKVIAKLEPLNDWFQTDGTLGIGIDPLFALRSIEEAKDGRLELRVTAAKDSIHFVLMGPQRAIWSASVRNVLSSS